jgi:hypothetical protein
LHSKLPEFTNEADDCRMRTPPAALLAASIAGNPYEANAMRGEAQFGILLGIHLQSQCEGSAADRFEFVFSTQNRRARQSPGRKVREMPLTKMEICVAEVSINTAALDFNRQVKFAGLDRIHSKHS